MAGVVRKAAWDASGVDKLEVLVISWRGYPDRIGRVYTFPRALLELVQENGTLA